MTFDLSRRALLETLGGASAAYLSLNALGLLPVSTAFAAPPQLAPGSGRGKKVAVLGAGVAGLTATLLLRKAGYQCTVLEARARPGGRVWTLRNGDVIVETGSTQQVIWDRDLYFNAGASRLFYGHQAILGYCRDLNVALETYVSDNRAALIQLDGVFGGKPQRLMRVLADMRGAVAALAAKAAPPDGSLDALLRNFGALQSDMSYTGASRAGFASRADEPGAGAQPGTLQPPLPVGEIARAHEARIIALALIFSELWDHASTMLQPAGGMDMIVRAMVKAAGDGISYRQEVEEIRRIGERARIVTRNLQTGQRTATEADYVVCTIPLPVLKSIRADFSPPVKQAVDAGAAVYAPAVKVAFETPRRWWETDDQIYGGISWTSSDINQIWYPSHGYNSRKGIIAGAYIYDYDAAKRYAAMTPDQRRAAAIADGEKLHPGYAKLVGSSASVVWQNVPYSLGGWAAWDAFPPSRQTAYPVLLAGDGPFYFAGEHMSYINGWQEGAVQSAHQTVGQIAARVKASSP
jgi:monoamine oxidase